MNVYLFQKDLRIHDQPLLKKALENGPTIGLFVVSNDALETTPQGFLKRGLHQRAFMYDSLFDLKNKLTSFNVPLLTTIGSIHDIINTLSTYISIDNIYFETLPGFEEQRTYETIRSLSINCITETFHSLYHVTDLPFSINHVPQVFTSFRGKVEHITPIKKTISILKQKEMPHNLPSWWITKKDLLIETHKSTYVGGETEGLKRINEYFFETKKVNRYKFTRNGMLHKDDSTKFSPYLAWGNLSPRYIYEQLKLFEETHDKNISTYWVYFELLWRDYFYFIHLMYKNQIFHQCGLKSHCAFNDDQQQLSLWMTGKTGYPLVDANMKELIETGFMSNRGRQNVANFLTKQLKQDWRIGAAFFESYLIDFDVSSNTLNWLYTAGLGNDPREDRIFNVTLQGKRYDEKGMYAKQKLPELTFVPDDLIYDIPYFSNQERETYGITAYPKPIIPPRGKR
jgi:deoxyribodipyrimidine photo-lyase